MKKLKRHTVEENLEFILNKNSPEEIVKQYRITAKNLIKLMENRERKAVVITSPNSGEGKSLSCVNIARALADLGKSVLVIDANIRAPYIHCLYGLPNEEGLTSVLSHRNFPAATVSNKIFAISSGPKIEDTPSHLRGENMRKLIKSSEDWYDYILIDTPDLSKEDALVMGSFTAGILLVIRENYTKHPDLIKSVRKIKNSGGTLIGLLKVGCTNGQLIPKKHKKEKKVKEKVK